MIKEKNILLENKKNLTKIMNIENFILQKKTYSNLMNLKLIFRHNQFVSRHSEKKVHREI